MKLFAPQYNGASALLTGKSSVNKQIRRFVQQEKCSAFCFFLFLKEKEAKRTSLQNRFAVLLTFTTAVLCIFQIRFLLIIIPMSLDALSGSQKLAANYN